MYQDKTLKCRDCGAEFVFTASEQAFFAEKAFQNEPFQPRGDRPVYCRDCFEAHRQSRY